MTVPNCPMRFTIVGIIVAAIGAATQKPEPSAVDPEITRSNVEAFLEDKDVVLRRKAAWFLLGKSQNRSIERMMHLGRVALGDQDPEVKGHGAHVVYRAAFAQAYRASGPKPRKLELGQDDMLFQMLVDAAGNASLEATSKVPESVGKSAILALGFLFWDHADLEKTVLELMRARKAQPRFEDVQIATLTMAENPLFTDEGARELILAGLQSNDATVQVSAASAASKVRPEGALKVLAEKYMSSTQAEVRRKLAVAILSFGEESRELLPGLETARGEAVARVEALGELIKLIEEHRQESK